MKTFKVKNYKGNLIESLSRFQKSHKGMKIIEACEEKNELKIKAEESEKIEEESKTFSATEDRIEKKHNRLDDLLYTKFDWNGSNTISYSDFLIELKHFLRKYPKLKNEKMNVRLTVGDENYEGEIVGFLHSDSTARNVAWLLANDSIAKGNPFKPLQ